MFLVIDVLMQDQATYLTIYNIYIGVSKVRPIKMTSAHSYSDFYFHHPLRTTRESDQNMIFPCWCSDKYCTLYTAASDYIQ